MDGGSSSGVIVWYSSREEVYGSGWEVVVAVGRLW